VLLEQHAQLNAQVLQRDEEYVGIICRKTNATEIIKDAISAATHMCDRVHGVVPDVTIHGRTSNTFPYVPSHLYYMLLELLKNSMRATVEFHKDKIKLPEIKVVIADSKENEDVCIKVVDEGGGIPRSSMGKIFSYMYSTAQFDYDSLDELGDQPVLAGMGYGLPVAKCYARYFGGDLQLMSMEGYGTDAYLYLNKLGENEEPLQ
jgi:pyruvate dehydrogenase kinase 2/3/4